MPIFFPDNDNRKARVIQLGSDAQEYLYQAHTDYTDFEALLKIVNNSIADTYTAAGLQPPGITSVDIYKAAEVASEGESKLVDISKVIADIAGFFTTVKYLVPGATKALVDSGTMAEETASRVLTRFTIPLIDRDVAITLGDVAGSIVGGLIGGIAIAGIDLGIDAIEGAKARGKLRDGINQVFPLRAGTKLSQEKAATLLSSLRAVKTTLDAISGAGVPLTDQLIQNLINRDVNPSIQTEQAITPATVAAELKEMDMESKAWTNEDPS
jgi:hypothetical protein